MKDKIKRFFIDKKELLIFIAVVVVVFATVITIATMALNDTPVAKDDPTVEPNEPDNPTINPDDPVTPDEPVTEIIKFSLPVLGEYEIVRKYFDLSLSDEELEKAIIETGGYFLESKGISYAKADNSIFEVCSIYDGEVISVLEDELLGTCVTIKHSDSIISVYSSLSDVTVKVNDSIKVGQVIGKSSATLTDVEAGVHMHLEVKINNSYVNPTTVFGKEISEVSTSK